ncbi:dihydroxyacetone kinase family protein [Mycolicibacterium brisbanense]|uniref:Dihydroxyacetone kinase n=1 Tax=Mycolicibacterium brisbanense TaxID=146020 RepID=A0A100W271_9MYCO|nr:dihydroxyacetone kinase family protein [Mycolicibacterium brisbanense]MCV7157595.1 dihydroxyacetone kinase family protein [Mycolicibacterium brisbanense]GAS90236.1 dihydroxyacetone kinase [Mycolicibacterium brisbanense]
MTKLYDDPRAFSDDLLEGFVDLHADRVLKVEGGVVRAAETPGKVAVVVGGGSGHYPAFCGVVGTGFADGAVVGNVFTSPSTQEAYSVGRAAENGAGLLFSTGNYAGDVMNFTLAQQRLQQEGIDTRVVFVTDDIASAPVEEIHKRRGIAGDFVVFKIAGAAAEAGYDLDGVERVARLANDRTRTLGVAFGGCTMPGADTPLFTVPDGRMGVGLGIHGEPGIDEGDLPRAADLARRLVDGVLAEAPGDTNRVGVILNGLGATKYEELFVVWRTVAPLLRSAGYTLVDPEVGELVTSLDMAGCSLTLVFLDDELDELWRAPADTPAYRKGVATAATAAPRRVVTAATVTETEAVEVSQASRRCAQNATAVLAAMAAAIEDAADELGRVDAVAGDGDHGRGMVKGTSAALQAAELADGSGAGAASVLTAAGEAWASQAGGTSGVLWGAALAALGARLGDDADTIAPSDVAAAVRAGLEAITTLGKASVGDKTMLDALVPFVDRLERETAAGAELADAWARAAADAEQAAQATADLKPKVGRARPLAERSLGTPDAGALSLALCVRTAAAVLAQATADDTVRSK